MLRLREDDREAMILTTLSMTVISYFPRGINSSTGGFTPYVAAKLF
jgi:hypothetical protein